MTPYADFSACFQDPEVNSGFVVQQRADRIDAHGRTQPRVVDQYPAVGVIVPASANDMLRLPDQENQNRTVSISTPARLEGPAPGRQPDYVIWRGQTYVVRDVAQAVFGPGWVNVLAQHIDVPQEGREM